MKRVGIVRYIRNLLRLIFHPNKFKLINKVQSNELKSNSFLWFERQYFKKPYEKCKLPVSVIVTTIKRRNRFAKGFVIPMLEINNPAEIIIIGDEYLSVQEKRNKGTLMATQDYLFFCDDDIVLPSNYLRILYENLKENSKCGYAYTDYQAIVMNPKSHSVDHNYYHKAKEFNAALLKKENYISTMSLIRKEVFQGFDPEIKRFQDWDVWLTMLAKGIEGLYVPETGFVAFYLDDGITSKKNDIDEAIEIIRRKHKKNMNNL